MIRSNGLKQLKKEFNENINSHVFLIETNNSECCLKDIKNLIAEILDEDLDETIKNQIETENYLELIVLRPDGKDIKKDQILELQNRIKTVPVLGKYIFYVILEANVMNEIASNKLLKTIEEPTSNTIGFLITTNEDVILPTIKSRCAHITAIYDEESTSEDINLDVIKDVGLLIKSIETNNHIDYYKYKTTDNIKDNYKLVENLIKDYYNTACNIKKSDILDKEIIELIQKNNKQERIIKKAKYLNKTLNKLTINMNGDLLLEKIYIELKGV